MIEEGCRTSLRCGALLSESVKARLWLRLSSLPRHSHATLGSPSSSYRTTRQTLRLSHSAAIDPLSTRKGSVCQSLYPSCPIRLQGAAAECSPCDFSCAKLARSGIAARASPGLSSKILAYRSNCVVFFRGMALWVKLRGGFFAQIFGDIQKSTYL